MKLISWLKTLFRRKIYRKCLCIKFEGKWKEVKSLSYKSKEITIIDSYYQNGKTLSYYNLRNVDLYSYKFKMKRIVVGYVS